PERQFGFSEPAWTPSENRSSATADPATLEPAMERGSTDMADAKAPDASIPATGLATKSTTGPATSVPTKDRENRRKHVRTRVNFKACVRRAGMADDVVACEDMSRG